MGGGGVMRTAAKVAGVGGVRGIPGVSPAEHAVSAGARRATRPVSAMVSSSDEVDWNVLTASQNNPIDAAVQKPCWELDDWEFAGGEEDTIGRSGDSIPRLVFGRVPTLEEAKEATSELKDALDKVYLSSPTSSGHKDSYIAGHESALSLLSKPENLQTKAFATSEATAISVPNNALKAFRLLNESPVAQTVVASIASDPNVWHAVLQNDALKEFIQTQKNTTPSSDVDPLMKESVTEEKFEDHQSSNIIDDSCDSAQCADSGNGVMGFLQDVKTTVVDWVGSFSGFLQNIFGDPTSEKVAGDTDGTAKTTFEDKVWGASFMGLAVMVIMVMVLKRA